MLGEDAEDGVVIVEPLAGDAMPEIRGIAERAVGLAQVVEGRPLGQIPVAGVHADDAVGHGAQECDRVVAGDDRIRRVVLHAEVIAVGDHLEQLEEDIHLLGEFGIFPEAVLVVVFEPEHDVVLSRDDERPG